MMPKRKTKTMKTEEITKIMMEVDSSYERDDWLIMCDSSEKRSLEFNMMMPGDVTQAIEHFGDRFPAKFAETVADSLGYMANKLVENLSGDLEDIWKRQDIMDNSIDFLRGQMLTQLTKEEVKGTLLTTDEPSIRDFDSTFAPGCKGHHACGCRSPEPLIHSNDLEPIMSICNCGHCGYKRHHG